MPLEGMEGREHHSGLRALSCNASVPPPWREATWPAFADGFGGFVESPAKLRSSEAGGRWIAQRPAYAKATAGLVDPIQSAEALAKAEAEQDGGGDSTAPWAAPSGAFRATSPMLRRELCT